MSALAFDKKVRVVSALVEGVSIRATERMTDITRKAIGRAALNVGESCRRLHNALMRDLQIAVIEVDEIWAFIGKKQKRLTPQDPPEMGDCYTYIGMAATQKAILSYTVGKRDGATTNDFILDLRERVTNRPQITSDGFVPYIDAIKAAFGDEVDYAMIIKEYGNYEPTVDDVRYSRSKCTRAEKRIIVGDPDYDLISTSYIERQNLTVRMQMRRFTRLTNAFSKRHRNHAAAVALYVCWFNFCRLHETLRITPAMAVGVTEHVWSIAELIDTALQIAPEDAPRLPAHAATAQPGPVPEVSTDDRQLDLLSWQPRPLQPSRPSADMEQIDLFPAAVAVPAEV